MGSEMRGYRGSLDAYFQLYDENDELGAAFAVGNLTEFNLTPDSEEVEVISTGNADFGQAADSMTDPKPTKCQFTCNRHSRHTLALNFMGSVSARSAVQATVTDESVNVEVGELFKVLGLDISAVTVTSDDGNTTYVLDTDYEIVDAALGLMRVIDGGSIAAGSVLVDYTKAAETGYLLEGGVDSSKFVKIFGRGVNRFNSKRTIVEIARGSIRPSQAFGMVGSDPATAGYEVTITTPDDGSAPFKVITAS